MRRRIHIEFITRTKVRLTNYLTQCEIELANIDVQCIDLITFDTHKRGWRGDLCAMKHSDGILIIIAKAGDEGETRNIGTAELNSFVFEDKPYDTIRTNQGTFEATIP